MPREREIGQKNAPLFNKRWTSEAEEKDEIKTYVYQQVGRKRERAPQLFSLSWTRIPPGKKIEKKYFWVVFLLGHSRRIQNNTQLSSRSSKSKCV